MNYLSKLMTTWTRGVEEDQMRFRLGLSPRRIDPLNGWILFIALSVNLALLVWLAIS